MNSFSNTAVAGAINQKIGTAQQNTTSTQTSYGLNMQSIVSNPVPSQPTSVASHITNLNEHLKTYVAHEATVINKLYQQLYGTLGDIHSICAYLLNPANSVAVEEFKQHIKATTGKECPNEKVVPTVLKLAFKDIDVKKAYTYRTVINFAISQNVAAGDFVSFVNELQGLENARKAKYAADRERKGVSEHVTRRLQTQSYVAQQPLSVVPEHALQAALPSTQIGQQFVLVASRLDNGLIAFNAASIDDAALAAALRSVYKDAKDVIKNMSVVTNSINEPQQTAPQAEQAQLPQVMYTYRDRGGNMIVRPVDHVQAAIEALEAA